MFSGSGNAVAIAIGFGLVVPAILLFVLWHAGDIIKIIWDTARKRDFVAESEQEREFEGRLISGSPGAAEPHPDLTALTSNQSAARTHVPGGCLVFGLSTLCTGAFGFIYAISVLTATIANHSSISSNWLPLLFDLIAFLVFAFCWMLAGVFALKVRHAPSIALFLCGLVSYFCVGLLS